MKLVREIVTNDYKGWSRKLVRRRENCSQDYKRTASSLGTRTRKKLTGREDWYKKKKETKERHEDEEKEN